MSGAGKTLAIHVFEDLNYFCIDNLPPNLMPNAAQILTSTQENAPGVAFVVDSRCGPLFDSFTAAYDEMRSSPGNGFNRPKILFLDASDEVLVQRFKETRRRHPLVTEARGIMDSIRFERELLSPLKERADKIIDTSKLEPIGLRKTIERYFSAQAPTEALIITVVSFGFKHGIPLEADLVFDVRFLVNPHYITNLRPYDGNSTLVRDYVLSDPLTEPLMERLCDLIEFSIPQYAKEGKAYLTIAVGCTGGRHRSVVVANELAQFLCNSNYTVIVEHRDVGTGPL